MKETTVRLYKLKDEADPAGKLETDINTQLTGTSWEVAAAIPGADTSVLIIYQRDKP